MARPIRLDAILAKVETTYGVDAQPQPTSDGVRVSERVWSSLSIEYAFPGRRDDAASGSLVPLGPAGRKGRIANLSVAWEARGAGAQYSASVKPEASALLRACGLSETLNSNKYIYAPADTGHESCTIYAYAGGMLFRIVGCRGSVTWPVDAGAVGIIRFEMQGLLLDDPVPASLPAVTYQAQLPPVAAGMVLQVGSWTPEKVISAEFASGVELQRIDDATAADGVREFAVTLINPSYRLQAYAADLATFNPYAASRSGQALAITQTLGTQTNNKIVFQTSQAYLETPGHTDQNSFAAWDLQFQVRDYTITFE